MFGSMLVIVVVVDCVALTFSTARTATAHPVHAAPLHHRPRAS